MKILVVGSGGREHAICHALARSTRVNNIFCAPGNAGIATVATCEPVTANDIPGLLDLAHRQKVDLTFVGGETSLAMGIVDDFERAGLRIVGPVKAAATLESSKAFAKDFMLRHGVPTARFKVAHSSQRAIEILTSGTLGDEKTPVVVKADGLAAGKGVVVAADRAEALDAVRSMTTLVGADAASQIVIEECLVGNEISLLAFCDGKDFAIMPAARDHKRIGEGDTGPNTGGMGTFTDDSLLTADQISEIVETIIRPTLLGCADEGFPYRGILFFGLMMTAAGPRVLEYNVRFGDPETQSILVRLETDLVDICEAILEGTLSALAIGWKPGSSVTVVLAADGYPGKPRTGDVVAGLDEAARVEGVTVFHAGTQPSPDGHGFATAGGRVLNVTAVANDLDTALSKAYSAVERISWNGMQYRKDIGR